MAGFVTVRGAVLADEVAAVTLDPPARHGEVGEPEPVAVRLTVGGDALPHLAEQVGTDDLAERERAVEVRRVVDPWRPCSRRPRPRTA